MKGLATATWSSRWMSSFAGYEMPMAQACAVENKRCEPGLSGIPWWLYEFSALVSVAIGAK
jgi:hypothetical protein